eukprot:CAMPEP_0114502120 /NCGR_PEP_ID=MMETSP0109-20121206/8872_1 /TAXON_ID=29199 /ORGANISM="Chlorarachnion reptans, Strain CCCM449" /LENGTH=130 /DNA_ID=CAMNT_0001679915 /DNA_START=1534 /DNA_END=1923 /DNA_ORIENTATION=+
MSGAMADLTGIWFPLRFTFACKALKRASTAGSRDTFSYNRLDSSSGNSSLVLSSSPLSVPLPVPALVPVAVLFLSIPPRRRNNNVGVDIREGGGRGVQETGLQRRRGSVPNTFAFIFKCENDSVSLICIW